MAGFWEKSFSLARNGVSPPMELQKMVFPWIEDYFGAGNIGWVAVCEKEMNEVDENEDEDENIINLEIDEEADSVEFVKEDGRLQSKEKKRKGKQRATQSSINTAKHKFLQLLIQCRRIILQDAVIYLYLNKENKYINTRNLPFSTAITSPSIGILEEYAILVPKIVDTNKEVANRVTKQQYLNSQMQLLMTINNASQSINTNTSLSQPPIFPVFFIIHLILFFPFSTSAPFTFSPTQQPTAISVTPPLLNSNRHFIALLKPKVKKKAR
ncbi:hypothetical protein PHYBLDRAFT_162559 [Phycomyces blakesleeanus NRRL 1555(-)]|uniref:Uncharacterized protein n=1 Tax=Phycomyces blakesleeanus (strain ATCC 8743b / DSM 1359 / FGSC 10004 / NBRC 33097 / NRRL 1555) TaxID=763407 RepID=A0A162YBD3_PHYB8|nr:hypothetical protein PHYBLDRAFT_162559 [Phycomyces blakesleeanus NRRL 1555(-)]OAD79495.1 hypothetical protein PHYBLDRAFT_162559 [Phycomyces blakesleeanus NRRL 1555(-)]|eukprot:XP_018297535.1 hypothetical protein PHYBLDRAFT_162559 [Phycomyces blakesleeanus NRRL 1555(-)]